MFFVFFKIRNLGISNLENVNIQYNTPVITQYLKFEVRKVSLKNFEHTGNLNLLKKIVENTIILCAGAPISGPRYFLPLYFFKYAKVHAPEIGSALFFFL